MTPGFQRQVFSFDSPDSSVFTMVAPVRERDWNTEMNEALESGILVFIHEGMSYGAEDVESLHLSFLIQ